MEWHEYINSVKEQIRNKKARLLIEDELMDHLEEQTKAYEASGMGHECAVNKSIESMGDSVEVGAMFDRVHRPQVDKSFLIVIGMISMFAILLQFLVGKYIVPGNPGVYFKHELLYIVIGILIMAGIYFVDYTILGKYPMIAWVALCAYTIYQITYGKRHYNANIDIFWLSYLFALLYSAVLFYFRKYKLFGLLFSAITGIIPIMLFFLGRNPSAAVHYSIIGFIMILTVTAKGWFGEQKKRNILLILGGTVLFIILLSFFFNRYYMNDYQAERMNAVFEGEGEVYFYQSDMAFKTLKSSKLLGSLSSEITQVPNIEDSYILVFIMKACGILVGVIVILAFTFLLYRSFKIVKKQKSFLGFIVSLSCTLILLEQIIVYTVTNFASARLSLLIGQQYFPFLSSGGRNIICSFLVTGVLLSVNRYTDLVSNKTIKRIRIGS